MNTIEKIRAEIERRKNYISVTHFAEEVLSFLSTLESEKPMNLDLEIEIEDYVEQRWQFAENLSAAVPTYLYDMTINELRDCARHFAQWQKEQDDKELSEKIAAAYQLGLADKEKQKPAEWSEEDEMYWDSIVRSLGYLIDRADDDNLRKYLKRKQDWLKSLPERFNLQPKAEWSEKDELTIADLINYFEGDSLECSTEEMVQRIKSLRPQWKPSEEQMKALEDAFRKEGDDKYRRNINSLYNALKKL